MNKVLDFITGRKAREENDELDKLFKVLNDEIYDKLQWIYDELGMPYNARIVNTTDMNLDIFIEIIKRIKKLEA